MSNIGVLEDMPYPEAKSIKMLNSLTFPVLILQGIVHIVNIINCNVVQIIAGFIVLGASSTIFVLNYLQKHFYAKLCLNFIYPIIIFCLAICYGAAFQVQFAYMITILTTIIFHRENAFSLRIFLISWSVFFYFMGEYYCGTYPPVFTLALSGFDIHVVFLCSVSAMVIIINMYISENERYEQSLKNSMCLITVKNKELNLANKELERFAYIASHDLKTPLRTIVSYLDLIERKIKMGDLKDIQMYIDFAKGGGKKMNTLVSEVLEYSRLNISDEIETEYIDLNSIISENITQMDFILKQKNAIITSVSLPQIKSNRLLIGLLCQNILENGVKYNKQEKPVVEITYKKTEDSLTLSFQDNGIGIEENYKEKVFEMFTRLQSDGEGSGMGLAICKKILERLGGKIWFESEVGKGTNFVVELPY